MAISTIHDLSVFTIGAGDMIATLKDISYKVSNAAIETGRVGRRGMSRCTGLRQATLESTNYSDTGTCRVDFANVTALSIGGTAYKATVVSADVALSVKYDDQAGGIDDLWVTREYLTLDLTANVKLNVPTSAGTALMQTVHSATKTDLQVIFTVTINSVATTFTSTIMDVTLAASEGDKQTLDISLAGNDTGSGAYPTAPTGTASLFATCFNAPGTSLAAVLTTKAVGGSAITGNVVVGGMSFSVAQGQVVTTKYTFLSQGTMASAATV